MLLQLKHEWDELERRIEEASTEPQWIANQDDACSRLMEASALGARIAYEQAESYRYPSPWKAEISLEHPMPRISDYLNAIASAGLRLTACEEPCVTQESVAFELK